MKQLIAISLLFCLSGCTPALAKEINFNKLANAIHRAENGKFHKGEAYGIHTVKYRNVAHARKICVRTVKHKYRQWDKKGSFLEYLSTRYCPANHSVWLKNVSFFYEGGF